MKKEQSNPVDGDTLVNAAGANKPVVFPEPSAPISFTEEELSADPKLEYLVKKHLD